MIKNILNGGLAIAATGAAGYFLFERVYADVSYENKPPRRKPNVYDHGSYEPVWLWDANWDSRDPKHRVNHPRYASLSDEERTKKVDELTPKTSRNILLIRHGQYHTGNAVKCLTPLGREQAAFLGKRLAEFSNNKRNIDSIVHSTMIRAEETAQIVMENMNKPDLKEKAISDSILEEGAPFPPEPPLSHYAPEHKTYHKHGARIEAAFRKYIHRASPKATKDSYELIVCHANVIRYFVCRALQLPPEAWLRFSLANTSITWLVVRGDGSVSVRAVGDLGHLPPDKISFG